MRGSKARDCIGIVSRFGKKKIHTICDDARGRRKKRTRITGRRKARRPRKVTFCLGTKEPLLELMPKVDGKRFVRFIPEWLR